MADPSSAASVAEAPQPAPAVAPPAAETPLGHEPEPRASPDGGAWLARLSGGDRPDAPAGALASALGHVARAAPAAVATVRHLQRSYGNRYLGAVLQRSCACGGAGDCESCADEERQIQRDGQDAGPSTAGADLTPDRGGGSALPREARQALESRFGEDFGQVHVHADAAAARAATAIHAHAFTAGRDIYFAQGRFAPQTAEGQLLLAHELTHVVQQGRSGQAAAGDASPARYSISRSDDPEEVEADRVARKVVAGEPVALSPGRPAVVARSSDATGQRLRRAAMPGPAESRVPGGGATPGVGVGEDLIFLVPFETATNKFAPDVRTYLQSTLPGDSYFEVTTLEGMFEILAAYAQSGTKVRRIRLVSHGRLADEGKPEGIAIGLTGQAHRNWASPKEVAQFARRPRIRAIVQQVMAPGAVVEFWGCRIGRAPASGEAWATLFQSTFTANKERFATGFYRFRRPARKKEKGEVISGRPGFWVVARSTDEIDREPREIQLEFLNWLSAVYADLARNGDIPPIDGPGTNAEIGERRFQYMVALFNRSRGDIRSIQITAWADTKGERPTRPGDRKQWADLWVAFRPVAEETVRERPDQIVDDKPRIPTDIPVREPERPLPWEKPAGPPVVPPARTETPTVPPETSVPEVPLESRAAECQTPDSSPAGSVFERVAFSSDHAAVVPPGHVALANFVTALGRDAQNRPVRVDGYASTDGPEAYNLALACRRAQAVSAELTAHHGIPARNLTVYAHGETSEFSARSRAENRIVIVSAASAGPQGQRSLTDPSQGRLLEEPNRPHSGKRDDPHLLLSGEAAARAVARVLPTANPIRVSSGGMGWVVMTPGTMWDVDKMLVYASEMTTYYVIGDNLYESSTATFLRSYWFGALAEGARRAEHWITISKVEIAFLEGIFVPIRVSLLVAAVRLAFLYVTHKEIFHAVFRQAPQVMGLLWDLAWQHPRLAGQLVKTALKELFSSALSGIGPADVAFFLGRLLHGKRSGALGLQVELPAEVTLRVAARIIGKTAVLVFAAHALPMAAHDVTARLEGKVGEMRSLMAAEGATISEEEARVLLRELMIHPETAHRLTVLQAALQDFVPAVRALQQVLSQD